MAEGLPGATGPGGAPSVDLDLEADWSLDLTGRAASALSPVIALWRSRELIGILARKDFYVRYRRATFGVLWAAALPLLQAVVLAALFSRVARLHTGGNFFLYVFSGMVVWSMYSNAVGAAATAIVDNAALASKIYFPRLVLPVASVLANSYATAVNVLILLVITLVSSAGFGLRTLLIVPGLLLTFVTAAALSLPLAALHVYFRDIRYIVQAALLLQFYLTPVFYPLGEIHGVFLDIVRANPLTGAVQLMNHATGRTGALWYDVLVSCVWVALAVVAAVELHRRFDRVFSDLQ